MDINYEKLHQTIKDDKELTIKEVATAIEMSRENLSRILRREVNAEISAKDYFKICEVLGTTSEMFIIK